MSSSTSPVDIRPDHLQIVQDILREHLPAGFQVWVFGSRAKWTATDASDLDLAVEGADELDYKAMVGLEVAFEESDLPYTVDVVDLNAVSQEFKKIVEAQGIPLPPAIAPRKASGEWRRVALGDVCAKIGSGATPKGGKDVYLDHGQYTLIRSQNVYNGGFHRDGLVFISESHADALQNVEVLKEDVLLNITGDSVARVCQVAPDVLPARVNQHVAIIRPDSDNLDAGYLRYCMASPEMQTLLLSWAGSGGTRNALTKAMIESLEIPLPPLPEQQDIAHILGALDDKIELNRRMNQTLEAMARAIFQDWFVDFGPTRAKIEGQEPYLPPELWDLFPDQLVDSELGEIPEGWEVKPLQECIRIDKGLSYKGSGLSPTGMPLHNLNSVYEGGGYKGNGIKFYKGDFRDRHITRPGDVLVTNTEQGHDRLLIGYAAIVPSRFGEEGLFSHHIYRVKPKNNAGLFPDFICHLLNTERMHDEISGYATGTTVNMLPNDALRIPEIVVPPAYVVETFSQLSQEARARQESLIEECQLLTDLRDNLIPRLVSGQVLIDPEASNWVH